MPVWALAGSLSALRVEATMRPRPVRRPLPVHTIPQHHYTCCRAVIIPKKCTDCGSKGFHSFGEHRRQHLVLQGSLSVHAKCC